MITINYNNYIYNIYIPFDKQEVVTFMNRSLINDNQ